MRKRADWMVRNDDVILEILEDADPIAVPPQVVHYHIETSTSSLNVSKQTVSNRLQLLDKANLVRRVRENAGYYELTDNGRAYLRGETEAPDIADARDETT